VGLPLIAVTVVIHVCGLALVRAVAVDALSGGAVRRSFLREFAVVMAITALLVTVLHGLEAFVWAGAYRLAGAMPPGKSAILYSLDAITSYGHAEVYLVPKWQLAGGLEALNGLLLFGLTTAFLFSVIQRVWPLGSREVFSPAVSAADPMHRGRAVAQKKRPRRSDDAH
jgi:hypothetical protein